MKRGTIDHPKTERLAELLGVPLAQAVGHLEMLFHFAAKTAPAGDIGRWDDRMIAKKCGWEGDPAVFIKALLNSCGQGKHGWLEKNARHRLVIHDWHEHAEESVKKWLARHNETFWNNSAPFEKAKENVSTASRQVRDTSRQLPDYPAKPSLALPSPAKPSHAMPSLGAGDGITEKDRVVAEHLEESLGKEDLDLALRYAASQDPKIDRPYLWIEKCAAKGRYPWRRPNLLPQSDRKPGSRFHVESRTDYSRLPYTEVIDGETVIHHPGKKQGAA